MSALWAKFDIFLRKFCFLAFTLNKKHVNLKDLVVDVSPFLIGKRKLLRAFAQKHTIFAKLCV